MFETYAVTVVATMVLAAIFFLGQPNLTSLMIYPLAIGAACLITSIVYQERLFDREVVDLVRQYTVEWNARVRSQLEEIAAVYPARDVELADLAETLACLIDGSIILARIHGDPGRLERQVLAYRSFVKLAFSPAQAGRRSLQVARAA